VDDGTAAGTRDEKYAGERDVLYRAGWTVLRRNGYANAGITEILAEAKLGTRAFYRHFESKDELLVSMFRESAAATSRALADRVAAAGPPLNRVRAWIDEILAMSHSPRHAEAAKLFASSMQSVFDDAAEEAMADLRAPLLAALAEGAAAGDFPGCDPEPDAASIQAIVWQLFLDSVHGRSNLDPEAARAHVERFVLPALGAESEC